MAGDGVAVLLYSVLQVPGRVVRRGKHWQHLSFAKLPGWMKDNEFLQFGHRPELNSFKAGDRIS